MEVDNCLYSDINVSAYKGRIHALSHQTITNDEIVQYIEEDKCVSDGEVLLGDSEKDGYGIKITAKWKDGGDEVEFRH